MKSLQGVALQDLVFLLKRHWEGLETQALILMIVKDKGSQEQS